MLESRLETSFNRQCRQRGALTFKLSEGDGRPDRMVLHAGVVYLVELKQALGRLSPLQRAWHDRVRRIAGVEVYTLRGPDEVGAWVHEHLGD